MTPLRSDQLNENTVTQQRNHSNHETVDTAKALIELYKSAFGDNWQTVFTATVKVAIASPV
jgi:hypothetical protein